MGLLNNHDVAPVRRTPSIRLAILAIVAVAAAILASRCNAGGQPEGIPPIATAVQPQAEPASPALVAEGRQVFRFETFGERVFPGILN